MHTYALTKKPYSIAGNGLLAAKENSEEGQALSSEKIEFFFTDLLQQHLLKSYKTNISHTTLWRMS